MLHWPVTETDLPMQQGVGCRLGLENDPASDDGMNNLVSEFLAGKVVEF